MRTARLALTGRPAATSLAGRHVSTIERAVTAIGHRKVKTAAIELFAGYDDHRTGAALEDVS
jgi:hypothetical protein